MIRAVFFDAGHTLLHPHPGVGEIYAREASALGASADPGLLSRTFGEVFGERAEALARKSVGITASDEQDFAMWREIVHEVHGRVPELARICPDRWFTQLYESFGRSEHWRLYPDARPALRALKEGGLKVGIVSNWSTRLRPIVRELDLEGLVDFVVVSSEVGVRKPDPRIFRRALGLAGTDPGETLHVGDLWEDDVEGAQAAGIRAALLWRKPEAPRRAGPAWIVSTLEEVAVRVLRGPEDLAHPAPDR